MIYNKDNLKLFGDFKERVIKAKQRFSLILFFLFFGYFLITLKIIDISINNKIKLSGNIKKNTITSHGMFVGSMTSALLGTHCPIKKNILLSLSLNFKKPVLLNYKIRIQGKIVAKSEALRILTVKINIYHKHILLIDGEAKLKAI